MASNAKETSCEHLARIQSCLAMRASKPTLTQLQTRSMASLEASKPKRIKLLHHCGDKYK